MQRELASSMLVSSMLVSSMLASRGLDGSGLDGWLGDDGGRWRLFVECGATLWVDCVGGCFSMPSVVWNLILLF